MNKNNETLLNMIDKRLDEVVTEYMNGKMSLNEYEERIDSILYKRQILGVR